MILALVSAALACPNCGAPNLGSQNTWFGMTMFLSLLPLLFMGGTAAWIFRRMRSADHADRSSRALRPPAPPAGDATPPAARYTGARTPT